MRWDWRHQPELGPDLVWARTATRRSPFSCAHAPTRPRLCAPPTGGLGATACQAKVTPGALDVVSETISNKSPLGEWVISGLGRKIQRRQEHFVESKDVRE